MAILTILHTHWMVQLHGHLEVSFSRITVSGCALGILSKVLTL